MPGKKIIFICIALLLICNSHLNATDKIVGNLAFDNPIIKIETIRFINMCKHNEQVNENSFFLLQLKNDSNFCEGKFDMFCLTHYDHKHIQPWYDMLGYLIYDGLPIAVIGNKANNYFTKLDPKNHVAIKYNSAINFDWTKDLCVSLYCVIDKNSLFLITDYGRIPSDKSNISDSSPVSKVEVNYVEEYTTNGPKWMLLPKNEKDTVAEPLISLPVIIFSQTGDMTINPNCSPTVHWYDKIGDVHFQKMKYIFFEPSNIKNDSTLKFDLYTVDSNAENINVSKFGSISISFCNNGFLQSTGNDLIPVKKKEINLVFPVAYRFSDSNIKIEGIINYTCLCWFKDDASQPLMESTKIEILDNNSHKTVHSFPDKTYYYGEFIQEKTN